MKRQLFTWLFIVFGVSAFAAEPGSINQFDTVFFDLFHSTRVNDHLLLPVYIKSDDPINSLDFAMRFDMEKLEYDSLIVHNTDMSPTASFNSNDSTLRLTAFSLQNIPNNISLVTVRFKIFDGSPINKTDFTSLTALLNGDACTGIILTDPGITTSVTDIANGKAFTMNTYPNPVSGVLNIETSANAVVDMVDANGRPVITGVVLEAARKQTINTIGIPGGSYLLKAVSGNAVSVKNIVVINRQ